MPNSEDDLIQKYFLPLTGGDPAARGLRDDVAAIAFAGSNDGDAVRLVTADMLISGVHFFEDDGPSDIAWKALAVNVSDLVSSGGAPDYYLLNICLNGKTDEHWLAAFAAGLKAAQDEFNIHLIGGDTIYADSGPLTISITAMGTVPAGQYTPRDGASPGDHIFVTGTIGDSALGCALRKDAGLAVGWGLSALETDYLLDRYLRPQPRLGMINILRDYASAAMDISDGLILDFQRLARTSGVGGVIISGDVPLSAAAKNMLQDARERIRDLLTGGDDYELLLTVPVGKLDQFIKETGDRNVTVTHIGICTSSPGEVECRSRSGDVLRFDKAGFDHFGQ